MSSDASSRPITRIASALPWLYLPLLLLLAIAYAWRPVEGSCDFWAHAAVGRWIAAHGRVPRTNLFLWSEPGFPWIAHSWLSQLAFFTLLTHGGVKVVAILNALVPAFVFFMLWRIWRQNAPVTSYTPILFALAIWVSLPRFQPRPELFSAVFLTISIAFLVAWTVGRFDDWIHQRDGVNFSLVAGALVTIFFLWVNTHGMVVIGIALLWITVLGEGAQCWLGKGRTESKARARSLLVIAILCSAATLLNPYGLEYISALKPVGGRMFSHIEEWKPLWIPPLWKPDSWLPSVLVLAVLFGIAFTAWMASSQRRWSHLGWLLLALALILQSRRMLWTTSIIVLTVTAANAYALDSPTLWRSWRRWTRGNILDPIPDGMRLLARAGAVFCLLLWVVLAATLHTDKDVGAWDRWARNVPEGAARQISSGKYPRRMFNDYEDSSYLQWRLNGYTPGTEEVANRGRFPLFIDLLNAYPDRLMDEYLSIIKGTPQGIKALNKRRINCILLSKAKWEGNKKKKKQPSGLVKYLTRNNSGWKLVYKDAESRIWVRSRSL